MPILSYKHSINSYVQELHTFFFDRFRLTPRLQWATVWNCLYLSGVCLHVCVCVGVRCFLPSLQPCLFVVNNNLISSDVKKRLSHCCRQTADCPCKYVGQQQSTSPLVILVIHTHTHFGFGLFLPANWTKLRLSQPPLAPAVLFSTRAGQSVLSQLSASRDTNRSMQVFYRRHQPLLYFQRHSLNRLS